MYGQCKTENSNVSLPWLENSLEELNKSFEIKDVTISGGEPSVLGDFYLELLIRLCKLYTKRLRLITNLKTTNRAILNNFESIDVSLNFNGFDSEIDSTLTNIREICNNKTINVKSIDRSCKDNPTQIIDLLNSLKIKSWEIIPYHHTEYLPFKNNDYHFYEDIVKQYLSLYKEMNFAFQNRLQLQDILKKDNYNTQTIYITPNDKFAVQTFDNTGNFALQELDGIAEISKYYKNFEKIQSL